MRFHLARAKSRHKFYLTLAQASKPPSHLIQIPSLSFSFFNHSLFFYFLSRIFSRITIYMYLYLFIQYTAMISNELKIYIYRHMRKTFGNSCCELSKCMVEYMSCKSRKTKFYFKQFHLTMLVWLSMSFYTLILHCHFSMVRPNIKISNDHFVTISYKVTWALVC